MRDVKSIDMISFAYCLYFAVTMAVQPNMFDRDNELYAYFQKINSSEMAWGITAFFICIVYFISFLVKHQKWISVTASVLSGLFFLVVGSAYMITYPNIGSGIFTIVGVVSFMNIVYIAFPYEEEKKEIDPHHENKQSN